MAPAKKAASSKSAAKKTTRRKAAAKKAAATDAPTPSTDDTADVNDRDNTSADNTSDEAPWLGTGLGGRQMPELPDLGDVGDFIRQQREKMEMSVRRLSELAGVSNPYLSQIERGLRNPSADILQQVATALRISVESLYVRAGILPDHDRSVSTVPEAIENDRDLSPEQKLALLNVYQSFTTR